MNGRAPNSPETGSQTSLIQKLRPNFAIESWDCRASSHPIATTSRTRLNATTPVPSPRDGDYESWLTALGSDSPSDDPLLSKPKRKRGAQADQPK